MRVAAIVALSLCAGALAAVEPDVVEIAGQGSVQGVKDVANNTRYWLNVPYGAPTGGANRFQAPKPRQPWSGVLDASHYGAGCPSLHHNADVPTNTSEDCLFMDIFAPVKDPVGSLSSFPVVVWFYGGGFEEGSESGPYRLYDGAKMASRHGVVVVQPNYRLGALGFVRFKGFSSGNQGLMDQDFALRWVQQHVAAFGGDPKQVTIMGESAGAMSVGIHLTRPNADGLFHQAIQESNFAGYVYKNASGAEDFGATMCENVAGCYDVLSGCNTTCLQEANLTAIEKGWKAASGNIIDVILSDINHLIDAVLTFTPVVDGEFITQEPLAAIASASPNYRNDVPILIGTNGFEGQTFVYAATTDTLPPFLLDLAYPLLLGGEDNAKAIEAQPRYAPSSYDDAKVQLSNIVTDAYFRVASLSFADATVAGQPRADAPPAWVYRFNHSLAAGDVFSKFGLPKVCDHLACHATELPFVWDNDVPAVNATFTPAEQVLGQQMNAYWGSFIRTGNPNTHKDPSAPEWPQWDPNNATNILLDTPEPTFESVHDLRAFWRSLKGFGFW